MSDPLKFAMVFTADTKAMTAGTKEARTEVASVATEADQAASALDKNSAALDRNAAAAKKAAVASREQAAAEKEARNVANQPVRPPQSSAPIAPSPAAAPTMPSTAPASGPRLPAPAGAPGTKAPPTPGNDNLDALRSKYAPLVAAQQEYEKQLADIAKLEAAATLTSNELAEAKARAKKGYDQEVESIKRSTPAIDGQTKAIKLSSYERSLMNRNISDSAQGLALGMPIQQVLLQQGPQIVDIYGGIGNAAKAAAGMISVGTVAVAAAVAVFAAGSKALDDYLASTKEVATAANGLGRAVAGSSSSMEASARAGASAAGISISAARSMEAQFLRTGKIGSENYEQLIGLSKDFAATMGISAKDAGSALADMFADPAAAAQKLYTQYGLIDGKTADYVQHLAAQNRLSEAQSVLVKALPSQLASAGESVNAFSRLWDGLATAASNAWDAVGKGVNNAISGSSGQERIDEIRKAMANPRFRDNGQQAELEKLLAQQAEEERKRQDAAANQKGAAAAGIAAQSPANNTARQIQSTRDSIAALQGGLGAKDQAPEVTVQINEAIKAKTVLLANLQHQQERQATIDQLNIQIQNETNPLLKAELTTRREKISLSLQEVNATEAATQAQRAGNAVINEAMAAGAAQAKDMASEIEIRDRLNAQVAAGTLTSTDAQAQLQKELELRPLVAAAALAEGQRKKELLAVIKQLSDGYDGLAAAEKVSSANDYIKSQMATNAQLRVQQALIGQNSTVQGKVMAQLQAEQEIRDRGLETNSAQAQQIRSVAAANAQLTSEIKKQSDAWSEVQKSAEGAIDGAVDGLTGGNFKDALKSIGTDIEKTALDIGVKNPLKNALLGTDYGTASDLGGIGGIFKRLMGGGKDTGDIVSSALGKSVGAMTVTAGTVMINGGVAGAAGSLLGGGAGPSNDNFPAAGVTKTGISLAQISAGGLNAKVDAQYASRFQGLLSDLQAKGYPISSLGEGGYSFRNVAGSANLSNHAFGQALDINPRQNPQAYGASGNWAQYGIDPTAEAKQFGLTYGGNWRLPDTMHFQVDKTADLASSSLTKLATTSGVATNGLGSLGTGLGQFGQNLSNFFPSAPTASGGGFFSSIANLFTGAFKPNGAQATAAAAGTLQPGLFASGGVANTASIFAEAGPEAAIPLPDGRSVPVTLSVNQAIPGSASSGRAAGAANSDNVVIHNYGSVDVEHEQSTNQQGGQTDEFFIADKVGNGIGKKGGGGAKTLRRVYNVKPRGIAR